MSLAPFLTALLTSSPITGWLSVVLVPMARMQAASLISPIELVMALLPKAMSRATIVGA